MGVDIFLLNVDENILGINHDIIPKEQLLDIKQYRLPNDRNKRLLSRSFLYTYLSCKYGVKNFELDYNKYKKPYFRNHKNVSFSISYSQEYTIVAVSKEHSIGIDIEYVDRGIDCDEIKNIIMCEDEVNYYKQLSSQCQKHSFLFDVFNIKEALIKCFGQGLYFDVKKINILNLDEFKDLGCFLKLDMFSSDLGNDYKTALVVKSVPNTI